MALRHGRVVMPDGQPVADALVGVAWSIADREVPEIAVITDAAGQFLFDLPPGRFGIWVRAPDGRSTTAEVAVDDSDREIVVQLA
jgi:uncharacterized GH25 family protein